MVAIFFWLWSGISVTKKEDQHFYSLDKFCCKHTLSHSCGKSMYTGLKSCTTAKSRGLWYWLLFEDASSLVLSVFHFVDFWLAILVESCVKVQARHFFIDTKSFCGHSIHHLDLDFIVHGRLLLSRILVLIGKVFIILDVFKLIEMFPGWVKFPRWFRCFQVNNDVSKFTCVSKLVIANYLYFQVMFLSYVSKLCFQLYPKIMPVRCWNFNPSSFAVIDIQSK